ncbi:aspartic peptidase domain-containing protein, partial [Amylostereum chailletii]
LPLPLVLFALGDAALAAPSPPKPPSQLHVPLTRRNPRSDVDPHLRARWAKEVIERKYNGGLAKRSSGFNALGNQDSDRSYYGSIAVGTPPVAYDVILDTGSADLWLAQSGCTGCDSNAETFNPSSSSSFRDLSTPFSVQYGSGQANGKLGSDSVQIAGLQVTNQSFGVCNSFTTDLVNAPVSGLLGLAWQPLATSRATPLWQALFQGNALDSPLMAFHLTRFHNVNSAADLEPGGTFTLGAVNNSLFTGDIDYQDIPSGEVVYWTLPLTKLTVGGNEVSLPSSSDAVIDTGTTLVGGPSGVIAALYAQIPGSSSQPDSSGFYTYPCSTSVNISLSFGTGPAWAINPDDFIFNQVSATQCQGAFFVQSTGGGGTPPWIIGDTFLKNVYAVFRASPPSVGFAALSAAAEQQSGSRRVPAPTPTIGSVGASVQATGN